MNDLIAATGWEQIRSLEHPELERHDLGDSLSFCGTRDVLRSTGLIPDGTLFPDECEAKRGVRWRSESGRRFTLSKGWRKVGTFRMTVYATPEEKRQMAHSARVDREVKALDKSLQLIDITEHEFRATARRLLHTFWSVVLPCDNDQDQSVWGYSPEVMASLHEHFEEILHLLSHGAVVRNVGALTGLKARKAALQNAQLQSWMATLRT